MPDRTLGTAPQATRKVQPTLDPQREYSEMDSRVPRESVTPTQALPPQGRWGESTVPHDRRGSPEAARRGSTAGGRNDHRPSSAVLYRLV